MIGTHASLRVLFLLAWAACVVACTDGDKDQGDTPPYGTIQFSMIGDVSGGQDFVATTDDFELVNLANAEMKLPFPERTLFPAGLIDRGNGELKKTLIGSNLNWGWHFVRNEWSLTDAADPSCDGNAVIVEEAVDYWVDTVGQFCPSGARIVDVRIIVYY